MRDDEAQLRLTIDIQYKLRRTSSVNELKQILARTAEHLAGNGLLSGESEASVSEWGFSIVELPIPALLMAPSPVPAPPRLSTADVADLFCAALGFEGPEVAHRVIHRYLGLASGDAEALKRSSD